MFPSPFCLTARLRWQLDNGSNFCYFQPSVTVLLKLFLRKLNIFITIKRDTMSKLTCPFWRASKYVYALDPWTLSWQSPLWSRLYFFFRFLLTMTLYKNWVQEKRLNSRFWKQTSLFLQRFSSLKNINVVLVSWRSHENQTARKDITNKDKKFRTWRPQKYKNFLAFPVQKIAEKPQNMSHETVSKNVRKLGCFFFQGLGIVLLEHY